MLYSMSDVLKVAQTNAFAIPAFNISSFEIVKAVLESAQELNAPVILEVHPDELSYIGEDFVDMMTMMAHKACVPVVIHLDHGACVADVLKAIRYGFTSVMIDGSTLPYKENVAQTKKVVAIAHALGVSVEAELGTIGNTGLSFEGGTSEIIYTDTDLAKSFVAETGIDSLAVAIGTAHGLYPKDFKPQLNLTLLKAIHDVVSIPLVLHGGSGNPDDEVEASTQVGICKVNISSDIKSAFFHQVRVYMKDYPMQYEPNAIYPSAVAALKEVVKHKFTLLHTIDKGGLYK